MMAGYNDLPVWIQNSKKKVQNTDEWLKFSKDLFDVVNLRMQENGIRSFGGLTSEEKRVLVVQAVNALKNDASYKDLYSAMSTSLDSELGETLNKASSSDSNQQLSKADLASQECYQALKSILTKWPDTKAHFLHCMNAALPPKLRYSLWKAQLQNPVVRQDYVKLAEVSSKRLVSSFDLEIARKSQSLIQSDVTLKEIKEIKGSGSVLRHILSYHHVRSKLPNSPTDSEYLIAIPFIFCTLATTLSDGHVSKQSALSTEMLAVLVEQVELFLDSRPDYAKSVVESTSLDEFAKQTLSHLQKVDPSLTLFLSDTYAKSFHATDHPSVKALRTLFQPLLRCFFVSYLPLDTVMFIFDQIIICYGSASCDPLPFISSTLLLLLGNEIKQSTNWRGIELSFKNQLKQQHFEALQNLLTEMKFVEAMKEKLEEEFIANSYFPITSTEVLSKLPPWRQWYSDKLVTHFRHVKKDSSSKVVPIMAPAVEGNELVTANDGDELSVEDFKAERERLIEEVHLMRRELVEARQTIREEQVARFELQERADDEIERLKRRVAFLQTSDALSPAPLINASKFRLTEPQFDDSDTSSLASIRAPPPTETKSPADSPPHLPIGSPTQTPVEEEKEASKAESKPPTPQVGAAGILRDLLSRMMRGVKDFAHGTGAELETLNQQTQFDLKNVQQAYEQAKVQVLGKSTSDEEIQQLPEKERQRVSSLLSEATRSQLLKLKVGKT